MSESDLFSDDIRLREEAAGRYRVFSEDIRIPEQFRRDWEQVLGGKNEDDGWEWPRGLAQLADTSRWPEYAFGTANAACLLVMHRPGLNKGENVESPDRVLFIEPSIPVLGGIPHAHNELYRECYGVPRDATWRYIHRYLKPAFDGLRNPFSQLMTCNLNIEHGSYGITDVAMNIGGLSILDHIVSLCQPRLILLCGGKVHKATQSWKADAKVLRVAHPSMWHRSSMRLPNGDKTASEVRKTLFGR